MIFVKPISTIIITKKRNHSSQDVQIDSRDNQTINNNDNYNSSKNLGQNENTNCYSNSHSYKYLINLNFYV